MGFKKKLFWTWVVASYYFGASMAVEKLFPNVPIPHKELYNYIKYYEYRIPKRDNELVDKLALNTENKTRQVVNKGMDEGIQDMRTLLNQPLEENWVYLPDKKEWHETGYREKLYNHSSFIRAEVLVDRDYLAKLAKGNKRVEGWHIHCDPEVFEQEASKMPETKAREAYHDNSQKETSEVMHSIFKGKHTARVSVVDMVSGIINLNRVRKADSSVDFSSGICSEHGVTRYKFTDDMKQYLDSTGGVFHLDNQFVPKDSYVKHMPDGSINVKSKWIDIKFTPHVDKGRDITSENSYSKTK